VLYFRTIILRRMFDYIRSGFQYLLWRSCVTDWSVINFWGTYLKTENGKHKSISDCCSELEVFFLLPWIDKTDVRGCSIGRNMLWKGFVRGGWSDLWQLEITCRKHTAPLRRHLGLSISCDGLRTFLPLLSDFREFGYSNTGRMEEKSLRAMKHSIASCLAERDLS
jgi:hypothetical protein